MLLGPDATRAHNDFDQILHLEITTTDQIDKQGVLPCHAHIKKVF